ncbi:hypothetical protein [Dactylosporangium sp. CA-139066]|uniref:hypothetical protein n=1 Tax=Dactylosporangium sp. CA-139066 TaxID=3239930 RepID=UPI003D8B7B19
MGTLADIRKAADADVHVGPSDCPPGHFIVTAKVLGVITDYLCAGGPGDDTAAIVGRIEYPPPGGERRAVAYRGDGIKGGQWLTRPWEYASEAFKEMTAP